MAKTVHLRTLRLCVRKLWVGASVLAGASPRHSRGSPFKCVLCERQLKSFRTYRNHMNLHTRRPSHECGPCNLVFHSSLGLRLHQKRSHTCKIRGKTVCRSRLLKAHMNLHLGRQPYACSKCSKRFHSANSLSKHLCLGKCSQTTAIDCREKEEEKNTVGESPPQCSVAQKTVENFAVQPVMVPHTSKSGQGYKCVLCGKVLCRLDRFKAHMNLHTGAQPFQCEQCGESFSSYSQRYHHKMVKHAGMPTSQPNQQSHASPPKRPRKQMTHSSPASCAGSEHAPTAERKTSTASVQDCCTGVEDQQNVPMMLGEPVAPLDKDGEESAKKSHTCEICGKTMSCALRLKSHMNLHSGNRPFQCQHCPKAYFSSSALTQHVRKNHTQEAAIRNTLTVKCATQHTSVAVNKLVLRNVKEKNTVGVSPPQCSVAQKTVENIAVQPVMVPHASKSGKGYKCVLCGKVLSRLDSFKAHMNLHTGAQPFQCEQCGESFSNYNQRYHHKMVKHAGMPTSQPNQQSHASPPKQQIARKQMTHSSPVSCAGSERAPTAKRKTSTASVQDCCTGVEDQNVPVNLEEQQSSDTETVSKNCSGHPPTMEVVEKKPPESERITQDGDTVERSCMFDVAAMGVERGGKQEVEGSSALPLESCAAGGGGMGEWETVPVCGEVQVGEGEGGGEQPTTTPQPDTILVTYGSCEHVSSLDKDGEESAKSSCTCEICGKTMSCAWRLKSHMNLHSGNRPFQCKHCPKAYFSSSALTLHVRTKHTQEAAIRNTLAVMCATQHTSVTFDQRIQRNFIEYGAVCLPTRTDNTGHVGSEYGHSSLFKCVLCGRQLKSPRTYQSHMNLHTRQQLFYECHLCNLVFHSSQGLWQHKKTKHQTEPTA